ncbi:hypothetical protein GGS21DRAFT_322463 [Xylaria nigripes]|nr:hypothetical protein GGS21DRAFT_322463 [Xylaria nigripes]
MLLKESTRILSSCPNCAVWGISSPASCITSSCLGNKNSHSPRTRRAQHIEITSSSKWNCSYIRCYASVSDPQLTRPSGSAAGYTWPTAPNPTPYEVLAHSKDSQYNKALFYELVKVYHPDKNHAADSSISQSVRLERYRLVVSANEILSNPGKRRAYDLYGAGWNGNRTLESLYREADRSWRNEPGNASMNATWEDWERWRQERNGERPPQAPVFVSNEVFVFILFFCMTIGGFAQIHRVDTSTMEIAELRDHKHAALSNDMRRRQSEQTNLNRHERVEKFLRERDSWNVLPVNNPVEPRPEDK